MQPHRRDVPFGPTRRRDSERLLTPVPEEAALSTDGKRAARLPETGTPASFSSRALILGGAGCRALLQKLLSLQEPPHIATASIFLCVGANVPCSFFQPKEL